MKLKIICNKCKKEINLSEHELYIDTKNQGEEMGGFSHMGDFFHKDCIKVTEKLT